MNDGTWQDSKTGSRCGIVVMRWAASYDGSGCDLPPQIKKKTQKNPPPTLFTLEHVHKAVVQLGLRILACQKNKLFGRRLFWWGCSHVTVASEQDTPRLFKTWEQMDEPKRLSRLERACWSLLKQNLCVHTSACKTRKSMWLSRELNLPQYWCQLVPQLVRAVSICVRKSGCGYCEDWDNFLWLGCWDG